MVYICVEFRGWAIFKRFSNEGVSRYRVTSLGNSRVSGLLLFWSDLGL